METTAYYAFGVPIYVLLVVAEWALAKKRRAATLTFATSFGNVSAGLGSIVVGLFLGPVLLLLYSFAFHTFSLVHWEKGSPWTWILAFVLADFGHYWHHRLDHRVAACWAVHGVHHMPEEMNFTVAMRHAWFSDVYSFPFYAPLPLLGVPTEQFFVATTALSVHALITHTAHFNFPSFGFLATLISTRTSARCSAFGIAYSAPT
jgi:alkylglycerol monooxygenase